VGSVIGPLKAEHRMGCNCLAHRMGDAINAILAAVGYNFRLLRRFIAQLPLSLIQIWLFGLAQGWQAMPCNPSRPIVHVQLPWCAAGGRLSYQLQGTQAGVAVAADDKMIMHPYAQRFCRLDDLLRHCHVGA